MANINELIPKSAIDSIINLDAKISNVDARTLALIKTNEKLFTLFKQGNLTLSELSKLNQQAADNTKLLTAEQKALEGIEKKLAANTDKVVEARIRATQKTKEQKDKITELIAAEKREVGSIDALRSANKKLTSIRNATTTATEKGRKKIEEINKKIDQNNAKIKQNSDALSKQKQEIGGYSAGITNALGQMGLMPPAFGKMTAGMKGMTAAAGTGTKAMKLLRVAMISTGIGALVVAVMSLVTWFQKTVAGGEALVKILAPLKGIFQVLVNRIAKMGEALFMLFSGDFAGAADKFNESLSGVGDELERQIRLQQELAKLEIQLKKDVGNLAIAHVQLKNKISASRLAARDQTKSLQENIQAQRDAIKYTKELAESRATDIRRQIALMVANEQAGISSQDEINERKQLIADLLAIEGERDKGLLRLVEYETTLTNKLKKQNKVLAENAEAKKIGNMAISDMEKALTDYMLTEFDIRAEAAIAGSEYTNEKLKELDEERLKQVKENEAAKLVEREEAQNERLQYAIMGLNTLNQLSSMYFENESQKLNALSVQMAQQKAYELELAVGNQEQINAINLKYSKKEADLKTKQAKQDKNAAIISANIAGALAVLSALTMQPWPVAIAAAVISGALAAVQIAMIASQPIPQFAKGTKSAPGGLLSVGEKGRELIETRSGKVLMANSPTLTSGLEGARIYSNPETERLINAGKIGYDSPDIRGTLERNNERLIKAIKDKRELHIDASKRTITERKGNYYKTYFNAKLHG